MEKTVAELAARVNGKISGNAQLLIKGVAPIKEAQADEITFLSNPKYVKELKNSRAGAIILSPHITISDKTSIICDNPYLAFAQILEVYYPSFTSIPQGVNPLAVVSPRAILGAKVAVGPYVVIEEGTSIGNNSVIYPGVYIGKGVKIGSNALIYANVSIREKVVIGDNVIIHAGAVIGSDGFGFVPQDGKHYKIPQVGSVKIGDEVEIGANVTIDRGTLGNTRIGNGTKIDNLVQIAHNVQIGKNCLIVAQVGISGSTVIEDDVTVAGQAGIIGHIKIGKGSIIAAQAGVTKDVADGQCVSGYPAQSHHLARKLNAELQRLPELRTRVRELEKKIQELEKR